MRSILAFTSLLALASAAATPQRKADYAKHKVIRVKHTPEIDQWINEFSLPTWIKQGGNIDVVVPPSVSVLNGVKSTVMHADLGESIKQESKFQAYAAGTANATWFKSYHAYADHIQFVNDLAAAYPSQAEVVQIGNSLQGRPITGIHFWGAAGKSKKPAVVIHGTVHAREWIGAMVVEYEAYTLLKNYSSDASIKAIVDSYDWYFLPVVNPDGFVYSQTTDRLWRKNRQSTSGSNCLGHDINRNWPFQWNVTGGSSDDPCAQDFRGITQGDAPENLALRNHLNGLSKTTGLQLFIDYHAYSQLFMTPYGYSCTAVAPADTKLQALAKGAVAAIQAVYGVVYRSGPICTTIYQATGTSVDYANDVSGAKFTFTSELRDTGSFGFVLPANQILPSGVEAFAGFKYLLQNL